MQILLLCHEFGSSASGVMSKRIAVELCRQSHQVTVVTSSKTYEVVDGLEIVVCNDLLNIKSLLYRVLKYLYRNLFRDDLDYHFYWRYNALKKCRKIIKNHHIDWIYCRSTPLDPCVVGYKLNKEFGVPVLQHFADPVPSSFSTENPLLLSILKKRFYRIINSASLVSFGTEEMLHNQALELGFNPFCYKYFVSNDVAESNKQIVSSPNLNKDFKFVYLGSFGSYRNPYPLFHSIDKLNREGIKCTLLVYSSISKVSYYKSNNIIFCGRTQDVEKAMSEANVLIDLDIKKKGSVYISSKLKDYIRINKLVVAITSEGSPTYNLVKDIKSIIVTPNLEESLSSILKQSMEVCENVDISDRQILINTFSPEFAVNKIISKFIELKKQ